MVWVSTQSLILQRPSPTKASGTTLGAQIAITLGSTLNESARRRLLKSSDGHAIPVPAALPKTSTRRILPSLVLDAAFLRKRSLDVITLSAQCRSVGCIGVSSAVRSRMRLRSTDTWPRMFEARGEMAHSGPTTSRTELFLEMVVRRSVRSHRKG